MKLTCGALVVALATAFASVGCGASHRGIDGGTGSSGTGSSGTGSGNNNGSGTNGVPTLPAVNIISGNGQTGTPGSTLPNALLVSVTQDGAPIRGTTVTFAITLGSGTLSVLDVVTDRQGLAQTFLELGSVGGPVSVTANAPAAITATFTETIRGPAFITVVSGDAQTGPSGGALPLPIVVQISDASFQPLAGISVQFTVTAGFGTVSNATVLTDAMGHAQTTWSLGVEGNNTVTATGAGLLGGPITFSATATP